LDHGVVAGGVGGVIGEAVGVVWEDRDLGIPRVS
jgi:hypothetical protein